MMRSMTGFGKGRAAANGMTVEAEVRSVNHRYFRFKAVVPDALAAHVQDMEERVRASVHRGTVELAVAVRSRAPLEPPRLNRGALRGYVRELRRAQAELRVGGDVPLSLLMTLPHVWSADGETRSEGTRLWGPTRRAVEAAVEDHARARLREGRGIQRACASLMDRMEESVRKVRARAPEVVRAHQDRLRERVQALLAGSGASLQPHDLLREVALFADRCDIAEELQRLEAHLGEARRVLGAAGEVGRRLDFLSQEILRESNTIGVKSNDYAIAAEIVNLKADIEKLKEQIENVE